MNCPGGMLLYRRKTQSYRDLPLRMGELGLVHRHELSGALHGLMRARCFTQDDAHIFNTRTQVESEIAGVIQLIDHVYSKVFGFPYHVELSTKPEKAMGDDAIWELATAALENALTDAGMPYQVNPGNGACYGPKIDFHLRDCLERTWQCGTVQLDFLLPERFDLHYIGEDGERQRPIMLHRVLFGSLERFIAILTEHFAGAFPTWLAPVQAAVIPINDGLNAYAQHVADELRAAGVRVDVDGRSEKVGYKIRQAQIQQIPYMLVVGEREQSAGETKVCSRCWNSPGGYTMKLLSAHCSAKAELLRGCLPQKPGEVPLNSCNQAPGKNFQITLGKRSGSRPSGAGNLFRLPKALTAASG